MDKMDKNSGLHLAPRTRAPDANARKYVHGEKT